MNNDQILWTEKPSYVFNIALLDQDNYYDAAMGPIGIFYMFALFITFIVFSVGYSIEIEFPIWFYIIVITTSMLIPDLILWLFLKSKVYVVTEKFIIVYSDSNVLEIKIDRNDILDFYSISESNKVHSVVLTYKDKRTEKVRKQKIKNIKSLDRLKEILDKGYTKYGK